MQTPYLPRAIFGDDFNHVYEPAEDTFLLLDALEQDLELLKEGVDICLECGSGSGTIITALSIAFKQGLEQEATTKNRLMLATDINHEACRTTRKCASYHNQLHNLEIIRTNLAESLVDRLGNSVDLLLFNPPYVPTDSNETVEGANQLQHSWAGGKKGRELIDIFLESYVPRLLNKPNGVAYMVALSENNINELCNALSDKHKLAGKVVLQRRAGPELLHVIKYQWIT
uniref:Methyltransferase HEMK2 n=1 Tax=Aceria tosichella TaxID=561515 RepID=A0A6G1SAL7_9ACAR